MELKPGYKQTEVGLIPDNWTIETMGGLGKWLSGGTPSPTFANSDLIFSCRRLSIGV
jgi:hypothetical protein